MEKVSNKLPTLRNQMMKKLMSFQSVLHRATFTKYMNIVINKNKVSVLKINDELNKIDAPTTTQIIKKIAQPKKIKAKINLNEVMKTRQPKVVMKVYKTSNPESFMATKGSVQGILVAKDNQWFFEYYQNDQFISEMINVKF